MSLTDYTIPSLADIKKLSDNGNHKFTVVSTFAGGGGSSTGYRMAGGKVLAVNEFIEEAQRTYKANWPDTLVIPNDIREITGVSILEQLGLKELELDIFDGSPPCSAFSTAGKGSKGWGDKVKKYSDKSQSNVEDLFFEYIRLLREIKPKCFIAENVAGLTVGKAKGYLNEILRELRKSGYHVEAKVLNAKWLGIPQSRNRLIIVGIHESIYKDSMKGRLHPKPLSKIVTLEQAFKGLGFTDKDKLETCTERYAVGRELRKLKVGEQSKKYFSLTKASPFNVSPCITAETKKTHAASPKHWDNRNFTVSETKRIMSIPDDYTLTGDYPRQVERLGRMVPPFMMKAVADNLYKVVLSENS